MARWRGGSTRWVVPVALTAFLAIGWLARSFELDTGELLDFLVTSAAIVLGLAVLAAVAATFIRLLRRLREDR
ncbi:MAG: hypothetical protein OXM56_09340 [Gammaproteobacteria bacterium]|nr:hypothetical protein [Gammaproteobacteria bacterium]